MRVAIKVEGFNDRDGSVKVKASNGRRFTMQHYEIPFVVEIGDELTVWYTKGF